jgi:hypothetical protein
MLTIIEGRWFRHSHVFVRDLIDPLFKLWGSGDVDYDYDMFNCSEAFKKALRDACKPNMAATVYVAAHGNERHICPLADDGSSRTEIANAINARGASERGLYFSSCLFGSVKNAEHLLNKCPSLTWVAGYGKTVDWVDSSALDLFFLHHLLFPSGKGVKRPDTYRQHLDFAVKRTIAQVDGLANQLGFHVYARKKGGGGDTLI